VIGDAGAQALAAALPSCVALITLGYAAVLRNVEHEIHDAHHPTAVRRWHQPFLDSLRSNWIGDAGAQALAAALPSCTVLTELKYAPVLRKVERETDDAHHPTAVCTWLYLCPGSLSYTNIGDAGAQALAAALPSCVSLKTLE